MSIASSLLSLTVDPTILKDIEVAVRSFNRHFHFRCGPRAQIQNQELLVISAYDVADFFRYVFRTPENELALFRLRRETEIQVARLQNSHIILDCLKSIHWNQPEL